LSHYISGQKLGGGATGHAKKAGWWPTKNLMIILKILRKSNLNSKPNLKITKDVFNQFVKIWINSMICIVLTFMDLPGA
jgi:hypothetical protein